MSPASQDTAAYVAGLMAIDKTTLPADGGERFNRLIFARSPYLLQHAENPVAWYEWGPAAFERARSESLPVLLSIGYATCHWCHVMAHESFEDEEVAALLNRHFVCIKVEMTTMPKLITSGEGKCSGCSMRFITDQAIPPPIRIKLSPKIIVAMVSKRLCP